MWSNYEKNKIILFIASIFIAIVIYIQKGGVKLLKFDVKHFLKLQLINPGLPQSYVRVSNYTTRKLILSEDVSKFFWRSKETHEL
jgi:hypothetical protein